MAEVTTDDPDREGAAEARRSRGVALADETPDELPALLAIAVGVAIVAIAIVWPTIRDRDTAVTEPAAATETAEESVDEPEEPEDTGDAADVDGLDIPQITADLGASLDAGAAQELSLTADGTTVTVTGVVADDATRTAVLDFVAAQPGVTSVVDQLSLAEAEDDTAAPAGGESNITVTAAQVSIVLSGTVADETTAQAIVDRATEVYSEAQVDNQLTIDPATPVPASITIDGAMTDEVLYNQVVSAFDDVEGVQVAERTIVLEESSDLETSLNGLEPIQFASGSAVVEAESQAILDQAADFLKENPDVAIEIGGHTDSVGTSEGNETLSQARAEAVRTGLIEREVTNELTAVGFGERRLKEPNDENDAEAQQANRRIEFRITN